MALLLVLGAAPAAARAQYVATPPSQGALYFAGQSNRWLLGGTWLYRADRGDAGLAAGWYRTAATSGWSSVTIPNAYNAGDLSTAGLTGYVGWYRRDFTLPTGAFASYVPPSGRRWIVRFESVNYSATVWLNGRLVGTHTGENLPFEFNLTGVRWGVNRLVVRVDNRRTPADLPPGPGPVWGNPGGLLREVYLRAVQIADLGQVQIRPVLPCPACPATIEEQALIDNETGRPQSVRLVGSYGKARLDFGSAMIPPHGAWTARAAVRVLRPRLWAPGSPYLYVARLRLTDARGRTLGSYSSYSGIRSVTVTPGGHLAINGRLVSLRGVELREENVLTGGALTRGQLARLMSWVRALGATVIRSDPLNPQLEELADRYGVLIWSEIPVSQLVANSYLADPAWLARAHALLTDDILTNQNHPSVFMWSIGNELPAPATAQEASYIAGATALARRLDPTRPVGMAIKDWPGIACQAAYAPLDVIGFNEYFGWFDVAGGATDDRDALSPFLDSFRACYPKKALFISEFGFDANRDGPVEERGTYQFQANTAAFHLGVFASKTWLSGAIYFILQDALAGPGYTGGNPWPDGPFNEKGLVDRFGDPKPAFAVVASIYKQTKQIMPPPRRAPSRRAVTSSARASTP
jgi:beta-glucuronidase